MEKEFVDSSNKKPYQSRVSDHTKKPFKRQIFYLNKLILRKNRKSKYHLTRMT